MVYMTIVLSLLPFVLEIYIEASGDYVDGSKGYEASDWCAGGGGNVFGLVFGWWLGVFGIGYVIYGNDGG
jgi:hypothetical protein